MSNPYPIFDVNKEDEIVKKIRGLVMKDRLKAVAINYYLQKKKKLDQQLEEDMRKLILEARSKSRIN